MSKLFLNNKLSKGKIIYAVVEEYGDCEGRWIHPDSIKESFTILVKDMIELEEKRINGDSMFTYSLPKSITDKYSGWKHIRLETEPILSTEIKRLNAEIKAIDNYRQSLIKISSTNKMLSNI